MSLIILGINDFAESNPVALGVIFIVFGILVLIYTYKFPEKKGSSNASTLRGLIAGAASIIAGLSLIFK